MKLFWTWNILQVVIYDLEQPHDWSQQNQRSVFSLAKFLSIQRILRSARESVKTEPSREFLSLWTIIEFLFVILIAMLHCNIEKQQLSEGFCSAFWWMTSSVRWRPLSVRRSRNNSVSLSRRTMAVMCSRKRTCKRWSPPSSVVDVHRWNCVEALPILDMHTASVILIIIIIMIASKMHCENTDSEFWGCVVISICEVIILIRA